MTGVEGGYVRQGIRGGQGGAYLARHAGDDAAIGIDGSGDTGIGIAEQPASGFDGTHASLGDVLGVGAAVAVPGVVGEVDQNLGAAGGKLADFIREDGFVADKYPKLFAARVERIADLPEVNPPTSLVRPPAKRKQARKRQIFAEGNEMHFVVTRDPVAGRAN